MNQEIWFIDYVLRVNIKIYVFCSEIMSKTLQG